MEEQRGTLEFVSPYKKKYPFGAERTIIACGVTSGGAHFNIIGDFIAKTPEEKRRVDARIQAAIDAVNVSLMEKNTRAAAEGEIED